MIIEICSGIYIREIMEMINIQSLNMPAIKKYQLT
jgi:hypothetical protein